MDLTFRPHENFVLLIADGQFLGTIPWKAGKEDAVELKRAAKESEDGNVRFALRSSPALVLELQADAAFRFARALHASAAKAEELEPAVLARLIEQGALLARMGASFGLTDNPKIQDAQWNEAQWGAQPRRMVPNVQGPRMKVALGTPTIGVSEPKKGTVQ